MMDAIAPAIMPSAEINASNASETELLVMAVRYLEGVRAHPRIVEAVRRAALRLLDSREGNGHAEPMPGKTFGQSSGKEY